MENQQYTFRQRILYDVKRHILPLLILAVSLAGLYFFADPVWLQDTLHLIGTGFPRVGILVASWLLITKFVFMKLHIQDTIKNDPLAVAVFAGLLFVGVAITL